MQVVAEQYDNSILPAEDVPIIHSLIENPNIYEQAEE